MTEARKSKYTLRVEKEAFNFACAHFLIFADGSREPLHGHNYRAWVEVEGELGPGHYVLDYITFKPIVKQLCDELDHKTILPSQSEHLKVKKQGEHVLAEYADGTKFAFPVADTLILDLPNTSTELLATLLAQRVYDVLRQRGEHKHLSAITVGVEEAPGQQTSYRYDLPK
ncbi:MAG: 6-carboxytetrahydropterin synthase [Planctomycetes bacterium]|jgi:6-pyruvoyltetrahydropterin/6-carboxytetrahydropterin synthase|nr:6-carboxytetrahydropterin synthase [Planctomycetota bacterium]